MNIQLHADHFSLSPADKALVLEKLTKPLEKLLTDLAPDLKIASVNISKDKYKNFNVKFDMNLPGKNHLFASAQHLVFESALIDLTQEVEKQIKKYRQELVNYSLG